MPRGVYDRKSRARKTGNGSSRRYSSLARHAAVSDDTSTKPAEEAAPSLPARLVGLAESVRKPFHAFVSDFGTLTITRTELAPKFMRAAQAFADEGHTFIAFVRELDATVPADRELYRNNRVYQAADYLRRLVAQATKRPKKRGPQPVPPMLALARLVATVLPSVDPQGAIWEAFVHAMHWNERQAKKVVALAEAKGPIELPKAARLKLAA